MFLMCQKVCYGRTKGKFRSMLVVAPCCHLIIISTSIRCKCVVECCKFLGHYIRVAEESILLGHDVLLLIFFIAYVIYKVSTVLQYSPRNRFKESTWR
jgi:hypothetical protein